MLSSALCSRHRRPALTATSTSRKCSCFTSVFALRPCSFQVGCANQDEVDHYWSKLSEGGEEGPCGWLKDRFGLSWQIVPTALPRLLSDPDRERAQRAMAAMLKMKKLDIAELERAAEG